MLWVIVLLSVVVVNVLIWSKNAADNGRGDCAMATQIDAAADNLPNDQWMRAHPHAPVRVIGIRRVLANDLDAVRQRV